MAGRATGSSVRDPEDGGGIPPSDRGIGDDEPSIPPHQDSSVQIIVSRYAQSEERQRMTGRSRATRKRKLSLHTELWSVRTPFRISGKTWEQIHLAVCEIEEDGRVGRGEGAGVYYLDDEPAAMSRQIAAAADHIESGISREELLEVLPAGGARKAVA